MEVQSIFEWFADAPWFTDAHPRTKPAGLLCVMEDGSLSFMVADDYYNGHLSQLDAHKLVNAIRRAQAAAERKQRDHYRYPQGKKS